MVAYMIDYKNKNKEKQAPEKNDSGKVIDFKTKKSTVSKSKDNILKAAAKLNW